jgi:serine/threonine protein kinase
MDVNCRNREDMILKYNAIHSMLLNEYKIGSKLEHQNIMKIIDIDERAHCLMLEHIVGTDLLDYLNLYSCENSEYLINSFYSVLDALEYMHEIGIAHRDIKLVNILFQAL